MVKEINTLIVSGGSMKGIAYIGFIKYLNELKILSKNKVENKVENVLDNEKDEVDNEIKKVECEEKLELEKLCESNLPIININRICCVSVGSIFGLFYILNYDYLEIIDDVLKINFKDLIDMRLKNLLSKYGLATGKKILSWLSGILIKKGYSKDITFLQLYNISGIHYEIIATNLNKYNYKIFDYINTPDVKIIKAIRMSIGIPFLFTVEKYQGNIYVDGGLINNYPIKLFDDNLDNVLGIKLTSKGELKDHSINLEINDINSYVYNVIKCLLIQKEKDSTLLQRYLEHTICIDIEEITHALDFSLSDEKKKQIIDIGYNTTKKYFGNLP